MANVLLFVLVGLGIITQTYSQCLVGNQNGTLVNNGSCSSFTNSTFSGILSCSGTQLANMSQGGFNALKGFSDAVFDLYTVVRSRLDISLVANAINNNRRLGLPVVGLLSNVDFARLWFEVKIAPYMSSLSPNTLTCLSQSNLTCSSFQALVLDFSSQTGPNMQNMVYQNFLKPYLTGNTIDVGCLKNANSSLQWLQLNFQNFSTVASLSDFTTLNPNFTGLDVLNVLTPGQKAELFFQMEASGTLSNNAINQIVLSFPPIQRLTLNNTNIVNANFTDILQLLKPFGQFVQTLVSTIQLTGFTNCNWTLPANASQNAPNPLNICNFNDWLQYVVIPVIKTFLQSNLTSDNVTTIFNTVFAESVPIPNPVDVCVVTSNNSSCPASQPEALALTCVAQSNLSFTEQNLELVITALSSTMQQQLNSSRNALVFPVELPAESFTDGNLGDVDFMSFWFQTKMKPILPEMTSEYLSCLGTRDFSCPVYSALVQQLSDNIGLMSVDTQNMVFSVFIIPFLSRRLNSSADCTVPFNNSVDFIVKNFGSFSSLAPLQLFSYLSSNFSALDAVPVLSPEQLDELLLNLPANLSAQINVITTVFGFLLQPSNQNQLINFQQSNFSCANYNTIFNALDQAISSASPNTSQSLLTFRDSLMTIPPDGCLSLSSQCAPIPINGSAMCASVNSIPSGQFVNGLTPNSQGPQNLCNISILQLACQPSLPPLNPQQVAGLLACNLPGNVTKQTWKLFFSRIGLVLDDALLTLSNMVPSPNNLSLTGVLDAIGDVRINRFSPQRLKDPVFMTSWFQVRLQLFLPSISPGLLSCLSTKNLSCQTYRIISNSLASTVKNGPVMCGPSPANVSQSQNLIYNNFILAYLSRNDTDNPRCLSDTNSSVQWVSQNFGPFFQSASLSDLQKLNSNFSAADVLPLMSLAQLVQFAATPRALTDPRLVSIFVQLVPQCQLATFISLLSSNIQSSFSCANYNTIFNALDQAISSASPNTSQSLLTFRDSLMTIPPDGCLSLSSQCAPIPINGSAMCASVNSIPSGQFVNGLTPNSQGPQNLCNISILQLACQPSLPPLNPQQVAGLLACNLPGNVTKQTWKLFFSRIGLVLDDALLTLSNMVPSPNNLSLTGVLDAIGDVRINRFSPQRLKDPVFMTSWFQVRLQLFLPSISPGLLSCLSTKNLSCQTYRIITNSLASTVKNGPVMCGPSPANVSQSQNLIYNNFILAYLSRNDTDNPRCLSDTNSSMQWVSQNFGSFFQSASLSDLQKLNSNFSAADVLPLMSFAQLLQFAATPGALLDPRLVSSVMQLVPNCQLASFFDFLSSNIQNILLTTDGKTVLITQIFNRANLSSSTMPDGVVVFWIQNRLGPLLTNLSDSLVAPLFSILNTRDCNISQSAILLLDSIQPSLSNNTKQAIYNNIIQSLKGPPPLKCYQNNSFIAFLNSSLFGFGPLPDLTTFLSLIPSPRTPQIINSISPSELGSYLNQPGVTNNNPGICAIFNNYARTPQFLDTQVVPDNVKPAMLPCIWPLALTSNNVTEVNSWFGHRLAPFLPFLNVTLLGLVDTLNTSCLSFKKMVSVLESNFTFNGSMITSQDVYNAIAIYLQSASVPKCYNSTDPMFNSTTWFVDYIGAFISYLSLDNLYSFGNIQIFTVDPNNILLFSLFALPQNVTSRFAQLIYLQNPNFNVLNLPVVLQCDAPVLAFTSVQTSLVSTILGNFTAYCTNVDPQVLTALSGRLPTIDASVIKNLGNDSVGLTTSQLTSVSPSVLISGLSTLSTVSGWSFGQAQIIVQQLFSGNFQMTNSSNLESLGSLVSGIPSTTLAAISPQQILQTTQNVQFVNNILASPPIIQMTYVTQIIQVNPSISVLMTNVPDAMAVQIPRNLLSIPTGSATVVMAINNKSWKPEQAALFFDSVATVFNDSDSLSVDVLQGFSCTRVQTFSNIKVQGLIKACRLRAGRPKVVLVETQLTCMYNLIKVNSPLDFVNYPPDMLMYFDYQTIPQANCTGYFSGLANADFSVISSALSGNKNLIWNNARNCLGITGTSIQKNYLQILGNIVCVVSSTFIANSDPEILENLKNCNELSAQQITAAENLLLGGTSKYGTTATWNQMTLNNLGILPLYFSQNFWSQFQAADTHTFLKTFLPYLRGINTPKPQMKALFTALIAASPRIAKRATCTKDPITSVIVADDAFPYGYSAQDFTNCINSTVLLQNLAALCAKIDDSGSQRAILNQLDAALPNGLSDSQVQVLKSVSRNATVSELSQWSITKIDTLAALMDVNDGVWLPAQSKQIVTNFLNAKNNLTSTVLNLLTGPNICSLSNTTLATITVASMRSTFYFGFGTNALDVSSCSSDNKKVLFTTANQAFPLPSTKSQSSALTTYQLIEPYLGGANLAYIRSLIAFNVSMSLSTFINLDPSVISGLSVSDVVGLLGNNLPDLKTFENETVVANWISNQPQSELDKLNLGLTGGRAAVISSTAATNSSINSTVATTVTTTLTTITSATTKSSASPGYRGTGWAVSFTALALLFTLILK